MKKLKDYLCEKRTICLLSSIASIIVALAITFSCSKENVDNNNKAQTIPEARAFEKQFIVFDDSGNNSITFRVSSDDASLLANYKTDSYELIINPKVTKETKNDKLTTAIQDSMLIDFNSKIDIKSVTLQMDVINTSFNGKVNNYSLVLHGVSMIDESEAEMETGEDNAKWGLCRWYPRDVEYYQVDAPGLNKVKVTFRRTKKTCNNIKYYVCEYGTTNAVASCHLKHRGDEETFGPYNWDGITLFYKQYKNQIATYVFSYE